MSSGSRLTQPTQRVRRRGTAPTAAETNATGSFALGNSLLDQAREVLQSLQDEEQIVLNTRMHDQEWATQSAQILDFLPKLERSVMEMPSSFNCPWISSQ